MVSLKALKPGKFKGRGENAILSVNTAACSGAAAWDGDVGLRSGSTEPCRPQRAQGETLSSPWAELSTAKNIFIRMYFSVLYFQLDSMLWLLQKYCATAMSS